MESLATLDYPAIGYGLRYDYGIFRQEIRHGWQHERRTPGARWSLLGDPPGRPLDRGSGRRARGHRRRRVGAAHWSPGNVFYGVPHDVLVAGYNTPTVAILRLFRAEAPQDFDFEIFSQGDFLRAVAARERVDAITRCSTLGCGRSWPPTATYARVLPGGVRVRDILKRFRRRHGDEWSRFPTGWQSSSNDTHPAMAVAELMRFFVDEAGLPWRQAWELVTALRATRITPCYRRRWRPGRWASSSTCCPAMPRSSSRSTSTSSMMSRPLSRTTSAGCGGCPCAGGGRAPLSHGPPGDRRLPPDQRRGSLHAELLSRHLLRDFASCGRSVSSVSPTASRTTLAGHVQPATGRGDHPADRRRLACRSDRALAAAPHAGDRSFQDEILAVKHANKVDLAGEIRQLCGLGVDPASLYDVQVKRLHEYKRQLLAAMHIIALYRRLKADPATGGPPRTFIFAAKAAPAIGWPS